MRNKPILETLNRFQNTVMLLLSGLLTLPLTGQIDPDWVLQEIEAKRAMLERQRAIAKRVPVANQNNYDVGFYGISIAIDIPNREISGTVTIRGKSTINDLAELSLDFTTTMTVDSVISGASQYQQADNLLNLQLSIPVDSAEVFEIQLAYHGEPVEGGLDGFSFSSHSGAPVVSTLSEPYFAHGWFPCKDVPSDKADSADIILTVPDSLFAVSNGILTSQQDNGDGTVTFYWQERYPITSYLISLAITNYEKIEQTYTGLNGEIMPVTHWYYPEYKNQTDNLYLTIDMIAFFASIWGEYPFIKEKYGHAQFSWGGGMEHQTCTSLGAFGEMMICHELAHQWWGDMVTCANWANIWLNEGFARYSEALWREHTGGTAAYHSYMNMLDRPEHWQPGSVYITNTDDVYSIFDLLVYDKGAWTLHMLRRIVGDEMFFNIFPAYRDAHYMGVATTADFQEVCEAVCGQDMDWFFDQWIYRSGQPIYKVAWTREKLSAPDWRLNLQIDQTQSRNNLFKMPLDVLVRFEDYDTLLTVMDSLESQDFVFEFSDKPEAVEIDPEGWVLKSVQYSMIDPDRGNLPDEFLLTTPYPNPFNAMVNFEIYLPFDSELKLQVYDVKGCLVDTIEEGYLQSGYREIVWQPIQLASGIYFIRMKNDQVNLSKKVVYLK